MTGRCSGKELAFIAGKFDLTCPYEVTVQRMRDIKSQAPEAICELTQTLVVDQPARQSRGADF
jgi:peptide/nickel transport system substrate-binding protein